MLYVKKKVLHGGTHSNRGIYMLNLVLNLMLYSVTTTGKWLLEKIWPEPQNKYHRTDFIPLGMTAKQHEAQQQEQFDQDDVTDISPSYFDDCDGF